jgi:hypothetical protein
MSGNISFECVSLRSYCNLENCYKLDYLCNTVKGFTPSSFYYDWFSAYKMKRVRTKKKYSTRTPYEFVIIRVCVLI